MANADCVVLVDKNTLYEFALHRGQRIWPGGRRSRHEWIPDQYQYPNRTPSENCRAENGTAEFGVKFLIGLLFSCVTARSFKERGP